MSDVPTGSDLVFNYGALWWAKSIRKNYVRHNKFKASFIRQIYKRKFPYQFPPEGSQYKVPKSKNTVLYEFA